MERLKETLFTPFLKAIPILAFLILSACSSGFLNGHTLNENSKTQKNGGKPSLHLKINGEIILPAKELTQLYGESLNKASCPEKDLKINIKGNIQSTKESPWYIGMALMIPFWPAMPSHTKFDYTLNAQLYCQNTLHKQIQLQESEEVNLFFYGAIRTGPLKEASNMIHRKLAARLESALQDNKPADSSIFTDFTLKLGK